MVDRHDRHGWRDAAAVRHPEDPYDAESGTGLGRRLLFNRVPPAEKTAKNRLHIDLHGPAGGRDTEVSACGLSAPGSRPTSRNRRGEWVVMTDPEGNEFCVH